MKSESFTIVAIIIIAIIGLNLSNIPSADASAVCPTGTSWDGNYCRNTKTNEPLIVKTIEIVKHGNSNEDNERKQKLLESYVPQTDPYVLYRITFEKAPDHPIPPHKTRPTISAIEQRVANDEVSRNGITRDHYAFNDYLQYHAYLAKISVPFYSNFANPNFVDPPIPYTVHFTGKVRGEDVRLQEAIANEKIKALIKSSNMYKVIQKFED